jgi:SWIM zinc finger
MSAIAALAPDAASWKAASGLVKDSVWSGSGSQGAFVWGLAAGSGAKPYQVVIDTSGVEKGVLPSSCSCPSRKFPCKHALALAVRAAARMPAADTPPAFAQSWIDKRAASANKAANPVAAPSSPEEAEKAAKASAKRAASTDASVLAGVRALESAVDDLRKTGLVDQASVERWVGLWVPRLMDAKAAALADRLQDWPRRLTGLDPARTSQAVWGEMAALLLMARAFQSTPQDPSVRRAVVRAEDPTQDVDAVVWTGPCVCIGQWPRALRGKLTEWNTAYADVATGAVVRVLEVVHGAVRPTAPSLLDATFSGRLVLFPGCSPDRAVWDGVPQVGPWAQPFAAPADPLSIWRAALDGEPWARDRVLALPPGECVQGASGAWWWRAQDGGAALPLAAAPGAAARMYTWTRAWVLWDGTVAQPVRVVTDAGDLGNDG